MKNNYAVIDCTGSVWGHDMSNENAEAMIANIIKEIGLDEAVKLELEIIDQNCIEE
jgi:hypothetical protein